MAKFEERAYPQIQRKKDINLSSLGEESEVGI